MYLARELTGHSLPEIGRGIGGRNHTTVLHAVNRVSAAVHNDPVVRSAVDNLRRRLGRARVMTGRMEESTACPTGPHPAPQLRRRRMSQPLHSTQ